MHDRVFSTVYSVGLGYVVKLEKSLNLLNKLLIGLLRELWVKFKVKSRVKSRVYVKIVARRSKKKPVKNKYGNDHQRSWNFISREVKSQSRLEDV